MRIGLGYDVHPLVEGRKLILGGVEIPFAKGLKGHSDADALLHAIGDALLGALALGDLGKHFPDTDPKYKGASSTILLEKIHQMISEKGYEVANVDSILVIENPKMAPHISQMIKNIAHILKISLDQVSVKATREEGLGFTGKGQGMAAKAIVLLRKKQDVT